MTTFAQRINRGASFQVAGFLAVSAIAAAALVSAVFGADWLPLAILVAALSLPIGLFAGVQALRWGPGYATGLAIVGIILLCATFRIREIEDKSIDAQIALRLLATGLVTITAATAFLVTHRRTSPVAMPTAWVAFLLYVMATSAWSLQPAVSLVETFANLAAFAFLCAYRRILGESALVRTLLAACFTLCCLSIAAYLLNPQLGRMSDWVNGVFVPTSRLSGVFGTANAAGAAAGLGILLTLLLAKLSWRRPWIYVLLAPMLFCLAASNNRMSVVATVASLIYAWIAAGERALKLVLLALGIGVATLVMALSGDAILESLSRSGSVEEITSGTGRTRIWSVVLDLWMQKPLVGYGEGSAKFILPVHPLLFKAAAHAHNLYLNVLFAGGIVGLTLFAVALARTLRRGVSQGNHRPIALLLFPLIYGLTEPAIGGFVSFVGLCFYGAAILIAASPLGILAVAPAARTIGPPHR
ncbi:O-antigen ligase family protein [uncultured Enterovirga sp.]|uniref:O-antigen ligase family protein n=1 Tax=uncultured Enterovirga sp. TaxID=2026352 RepID=UPI0035C94B64